MKTRFSDLLKVKKQVLSDIEEQLKDVQNRKKRLEFKIESVDRLVEEFEIPQKGGFSIMQYSRNSFYHLMKEKEALLEKLLLRQQQIKGLETLYKEATVEYEKILFLNKKEIEKEIQQKRYEESKRLDEIANILFVNKREKEEV